MTDLTAWIGRTREASDLVTPRLLAEFRATFAPHLAPVSDGIAPPALHWCLAPETPPADALGPDGHAAKGGFLPPVPLPRRMWAGGEIETGSGLRAGDAVTRTETVRDVAFKSGRSGSLCFVTVDHTVATGRGVAIRERQDIVYREAAGAQTGTSAAPERDDPEAYAAIWDVSATPTLLFRYSAMTFNGHRFHYDQPYATRVEGYADLVVHGPMQATLLMNLAATLLGHGPRKFVYRGVSPMTANQIFRVCGRVCGTVFEGVTLDAAGHVCMRARGDA
ncbi:3-methylfumaryl-CoA hydratase [Methylobacterium sp. PvP062]|uniref:3-methylfumaryl-CoA hydratase n=1 Tax=Methylobacterium radiotolerans TaxID=31998 RepID=A0ABV2NMC9_9HYPH|nr:MULTISPECIES: MaoC family dehydratase N-terminal domain-containing protein [unclassified Methylobacterium]MBP2495648.1 3-methylfumaryl-CoA hydratase [Methylobacterium sp. PvP105]MBP2504481.1 3-methylfumaryl-CoA hydratase [Methylobacterium sp. PvP109]MCX7332088.1 MaoC family dehydratase N-terminal domain-containing protein [Hyphomicrobiales bacterium]